MDGQNQEVAAWDRRTYPSILTAQDPRTFLKQHLKPLLANQTEPTHAFTSDKVIRSEEHFWIEAQANLFEIVRLSDFTISDWFPRTPGVFWSEDARMAWEYTYKDEGKHDTELGGYYEPKYG